MSNDKKNVEFKVGLVVIVGLFVLLFGILWGKNYRLAANQYRLSFLFEHTGGLQVNDPVTVNGVKKGQVAAIKLDKGLVRVEVLLDRDVQLFSSLRAYITAVELMGGKKVEIIPGTSGTLLNLDTLRTPLLGTQTAGIPEMMVALSQIAGRSNRLMERLDSTITLAAGFLDDATVRQPLVTTLNDLQVSAAALKQFLQSNQMGMQQTVTNLESASSHLRGIVDRRSPQIDSTLLIFSRTAQKLESFTVLLDEISLRLQMRQGNLSKLIYDEETYTRLNAAIARVDSAALELRAHLGKFLKGSNFNLINLLSF
ncbi:MAG: MlaD family protein [candidate division KSB1 bacterium]|nr:MlaD family protein [candidate division KSB1 bacterium]MDZ7302458.1 MlaD family protein [candidate division KSB1 bacterium]MDZ7311948.1 MlaD family protein [candidate division KSB1 bacterium]